jgi:hypothetical protein
MHSVNFIYLAIKLNAERHLLNFHQTWNDNKSVSAKTIQSCSSS